MISHNRLTYSKKEEDAVKQVVKSGYWAGGKEVKKLEKKITVITNRKYAIGVSSGLSALRLSLLALGVGKNDEVIVPAYSCVAIPNAVLSCGAVPIPADITNNNWNIDFRNIQSKISSKTKAIIAVNTFGLKAIIKKISTLNIPVIEDCAHAIGEINNDYIFGKQGLVSVNSFYATKLIGGGEGGAVMTDDKNISDFINDYRDYTDKAPSGLRLNEKMSNIDAALSLCQLKRRKSMITLRQEIADFYNNEFSKLQIEFPGIEIPVYEPRIWYRYVIYCKTIIANKIIKELHSNGIAADRPIENWMNEREIKHYYNSSFAYNHLVSLPMYPTLKKAERKAVVNAVKKTLQRLFI